MEEQKKPNLVDAHVGARLKLRRTMMGMSQEKLGEQLGITFQQVQKYEKGTNRMGAGRLYDVARILGAPIAFFFEDMPGDKVTGTPGFAEGDDASYAVDFLSTTQGQQLNRAFVAIEDPKVRQRIVELVKALAGKGD